MPDTWIFDEGGNSLISRMEYDATDNPIYIGVANPGSATASAVWRIKRLTWVAGTVTGFNCTTILFAGGSTAFKFAWDDRTTLSYS